MQPFRESDTIRLMIDPIIELEKVKGSRSLRALAREFQISAGYLGDILKRKKPPSERVLLKLGLRTEYVRISGKRK